MALRLFTILGQLAIERLAVNLQEVGASGLPEGLVRRSITLGVGKFNVNTEVREAYMTTLKERLSAPRTPDLLEVMQAAEAAMSAVVAEKLRLFGAAGTV